jgi:hypothetical protein
MGRRDDVRSDAVRAEHADDEGLVPSLDVRADGEHRYAVECVDSSGTVRHYEVECPPALLEELSLEPADEPVLVRCALELLLTTPGDRMPERFSLLEAQDRYPGLVEQLRTVCGR